jgi:glutamine amidotransferase
MNRSVVVLQTGTANVASVVAGLRRAGAEPVVTRSAEVAVRADRLVLPGVGAFGAALAELREHGLDEVVAAAITASRPLLCICLGMQVLAERSEESPGVPGLGLIPGSVTRFGGDVRVPQLGWNAITPSDDARWLTAGYVYFANSFKLDAPPPGWAHATATHGAPFVAAIERGPALACQFHPELSGTWGHQLFVRWLEGA